MDIESLTKTVSDLESLAGHFEYIRSSAKRCVDIALSDIPSTPECSRFGGDPFVPANFDWPLHDVGEYRFLGQINFAEISNAPTVLPQSGLLSLFYAYDEEGECFWGDDGFIRGFYWQEFSMHAILGSPADVTPETKRIALTGGLDIPRHTELWSDWPFDRQVLYDLRDAIDAKDEYMLGYPSYNSLLDDPTPGPEWLSLLTVRSLDEFDWGWHDGDKLMVFIQSNKLASRDFSDLKSVAG